MFGFTFRVKLKNRNYTGSEKEWSIPNIWGYLRLGYLSEYKSQLLNKKGAQIHIYHLIMEIELG